MDASPRQVHWGGQLQEDPSTFLHVNQDSPAGPGPLTEAQEQTALGHGFSGVGYPRTEPHLQLEPDVIPRLDTGQAQLPPVDPQEHSRRVDGHRVYLFWGRAEGRVRREGEEAGMGMRP